MDSHHRHELQQNDLGKITNQALPFFEKYGMQLAIGLAAIAVIVIGGAWWYSESSVTTADSWTLLDYAVHKNTPSADDFANVVDKHPGTTAAAWAKLKEAEDYLKSGMAAAFTNRDASQADLKKAQDAFQKLEAGGPGISPDIRERALFGLARCLESTSDGNTEDAIKAYSRLSTDFPQGMFKGIAQDRIKTLESADAKAFYAWFHQQKPEPKDPHRFPIKNPSKSTTDEPVDPDDSLEINDPAGASESEKPAATEPPADEPGAAKPAEEPSSEEKPAADKPDATEKPSETPGSSETP